MLTLLALALSGQLAVSPPPRSVDQTPVVSVRDRLPRVCSDGLIQADLTPPTSTGSTLSTLRFDG
uniref:hypothetical protein n=1 Tax=Brevundimonas nasdae TaxID=172043 RepID=UPI00289FFBC8